MVDTCYLWNETVWTIKYLLLNTKKLNKNLKKAKTEQRMRIHFCNMMSCRFENDYKNTTEQYMFHSFIVPWIIQFSNLKQHCILMINYYSCIKKYMCIVNITIVVLSPLKQKFDRNLFFSSEIQGMLYYCQTIILWKIQKEK
jgi:hypothetical protein